MATMHLQIVTPEARIYSDQVNSVVLPGTEGELGILPQHTPLLTTIKPGELVARKETQVLHLATGRGFAQITETSVTILTDMAVEAEKIDEAKVEEALARAQAALADKSLQQHEAEALALIIDKSVAQLQLKRRKRI